MVYVVDFFSQSICIEYHDYFLPSILIEYLDTFFVCQLIPWLYAVVWQSIKALANGGIFPGIFLGIFLGISLR